MSDQPLRSTRNRLRLALALAGLLLLAACGAAPSPTPAALVPQSMPKLLATVYISPTPPEAEQQATRLAERPTATVPSATLTPEPTVYVGVFLGEAGNLDDVIPVTQPRPDEANAATPETARDALTNCPAQPDARFGEVWRTALDSETLRALGCPAADAIPYDGTTQIFERGAMYFNPDGMIWAVAPGGVNPGRYWFARQAPAVPEEPVAVPEGLRAPTLGFGAMWRGTPGLREALGFARTDESAVTFVVQSFQGGSLLLDQGAGQVFVLVGAATEGAAYGPY